MRDEEYFTIDSAYLKAQFRDAVHGYFRAMALAIPGVLLWASIFGLPS